jgi:tight adherence protein C
MSEILLVLTDPDLLIRLLVGVATAGTILTIALPYLNTESLRRRMKAVSSERERIRLKERDRLSRERVGRVDENNPFKQLVARFNLVKWVGVGDERARLAQAGYRSPGAVYAFLVARVGAPIFMLVFGAIYMLFILQGDHALVTRLAGALVATYIGFKLPDIWCKNAANKRQLSIRRALPDALDLLVICVESGMSVEHAFKRVSEEIGTQSVALAEEMAITTAELSYLPTRRTPYENLAARTGVDGVRNITTVLIQGEKYGTPLGTALRVVSEESRHERLMAAEKKAAALPPQLTVPMILFFLPVLFAVILTPAIIQVSRIL